MTNTSRGVSRRTLVKGTAWAVSAVAVASAAPAYAASPKPAGLSSTWYSCNNGTFKFFFNPAPGITITSVTIQSSWTPFAPPNPPFTLTLSTVTKDEVNAPASFLAKFQNPKVGAVTYDSQAHFTTLRWCAVDQLVADNSVLKVTYTQAGVTRTDNYPASEIDKTKHTAGNAQNCGVCGTDGSTVNPGATTFGSQALEYDGKDGQWTIKFTGVNTPAALITKIEVFTTIGTCGLSPAAPLFTWTGSSATPSITFGGNSGTPLGTCGSTKQVWYGHYGSNTAPAQPCPSSVLVNDATFFTITHANGYVETLNAPANGTGKYKYTNVNFTAGTCPA